jgi:hypothetical protein
MVGNLNNMSISLQRSWWDFDIYANRQEFGLVVAKS